MVNVENQSVLFECMLKCSNFIGTSNPFVIDIDAMNDVKHSLKNSIAMEIQQKNVIKYKYLNTEAYF